MSVSATAQLSARGEKGWLCAESPATWCGNRGSTTQGTLCLQSKALSKAPTQRRGVAVAR